MAIHVEPQKFGEVIDFFGCYDDLERKRVKVFLFSLFFFEIDIPSCNATYSLLFLSSQVLHSLSFVEDPTRIFRAIRFEQRLGGGITGETEALMRGSIDLGLLDCLSGIFFVCIIIIIV